MPRLCVLPNSSRPMVGLEETPLRGKLEVSCIVNWEDAPRNPCLTDHELHLWSFEAGCGPRGESLLDVLSAEEVERAGRFRFRRDRDCFVRGRGVLRVLLSQYLGANPADLRFCTNRYGKPALAGEWAGSGIKFNLSHSHEIILCAFALKREVGVDVEHIRPEFAGEDIAARFFAAPEAEALRRTPAEERAAAFFGCWTRKEAYVKARGEGLSLPLDSFVVSVDAGAREVALDVCGDEAESRRWTVISLLPAEGYMAALAAEGSVRQIKYWRADV